MIFKTSGLGIGDIIHATSLEPLKGKKVGSEEIIDLEDRKSCLHEFSFLYPANWFYYSVNKKTLIFLIQSNKIEDRYRNFLLTGEPKSFKLGKREYFFFNLF